MRNQTYNKKTSKVLPSSQMMINHQNPSKINQPPSNQSTIAPSNISQVSPQNVSQDSPQNTINNKPLLRSGLSLSDKSKTGQIEAQLQNSPTFQSLIDQDRVIVDRIPSPVKCPCSKRIFGVYAPREHTHLIQDINKLLFLIDGNENECCWTFKAQYRNPFTNTDIEKQIMTLQDANENDEELNFDPVVTWSRDPWAPYLWCKDCACFAKGPNYSLKLSVGNTTKDLGSIISPCHPGLVTPHLREVKIVAQFIPFIGGCLNQCLSICQCFQYLLALFNKCWKSGSNIKLYGKGYNSYFIGNPNWYSIKQKDTVFTEIKDPITKDEKIAIYNYGISEIRYFDLQFPNNIS